MKHRQVNMDNQRHLWKVFANPAKPHTEQTLEVLFNKVKYTEQCYSIIYLTNSCSGIIVPTDELDLLLSVGNWKRCE